MNLTFGTPLSQTGRLLQLTTPLGADQLQALRAHGVERVGRTTWRDIVWRSSWIGWGDINEFKITKNDSTGTIELDAGYKVTFAPKYSPGDGTVPLCSSASSRDFPTTRADFAHGNNSTLNPTA